MAGAETNAATAAPGKETFPPGLHNAYWFSAFNALSYQIVLSSPMVLYAKSLNASATVLGVIAGMMPLLVIFQLPAAFFIPRLGFRRFVYAGWGTRVMFIFAMAVVPLLAGVMDAGKLLALLLVLLFGFNVSRGISSCAWLPWITALVPAGLRGKYLARDAAVQNTASALTFLIAAVVLSGSPTRWQFAGLFAFSAVMGAVSLSFLKRIPDAEVPEEFKNLKGGVPWLAMAGHRPFKKLLYTVLGWSVAYGGITVFTVAFLKQAGMNEGRILVVTSAAFFGGLSSLWLLGGRLDRTGSKPVLIGSFAGWVTVLAGMAALAGGAVGLQLWSVLGLVFMMGLLGALVQMSNTRLAMEVIPSMGRHHFFAIYSVVSNVTLGLAPIGWGVVIDSVGANSPHWGGLEWNRFTIFFAGAGLVFLLTLITARRLEEPAAVSMEQLLRELATKTPLRLLRFWPRG